MVESIKNLFTSKQNLVILVLGKTGAGKTTAINMMINNLLNVQYESDNRYIAITQIFSTDDQEFNL